MTGIIENGINIMAWVMELLAILLCINGIFKKKFKIDRKIVLILIINVAIFEVVETEVFSKNFIGLAYVVTFVYCIITFKRKMLETISCYILSIIVAAAIEIIVSCIAIPLENRVEWHELLMLLMSSVSLILSVLVYKFLINKGENPHKYYDKRVIATILICGLGMLFILIDYRYRGKVDRVYSFVFIGLVVIIYAYWMKTQEAQFELEKTTLELEIQEIYGNAYKELIFEVRRKQHDFVNQIGAIYSMHVTATSLEDLIKKQSEYSAVLLEEERYDKILTGCNNPILAGYLYCKCVNYEKTNILVEYNIHVDMAECDLPLHEVIEILGIFLTNAYESLCEIENGQKRIQLMVEESEEGLTIEVSNPSRYITSRDIEKIFYEGYSSKGENRGIGLSRAKQLAKKCRTDIIVENGMKSGVNWITFKMLVPK